MTKPVVVLENIQWRQQERLLIDNVNWKVEENQHWVILGLNGSGKTSLLRIITGYLWPSKGRVHVLGQQFGKVNIPELRKSIGWVSSSLDQQIGNGTDSALEVVISGKFASIGIYEKYGQEDIEQAIELLHQLGMDHLKEQYFHHLSQGEKRRVLIARALMANPKILILDEPCNGLDLFAKEQLLKMVEEFAKKSDGPTILYVTHHVEEIVPSFTNVLLLNSGKVVAAGEKRDMLQAPLLSQTFQIKLEVTWVLDRPWIHVIG